MSNLVKHAHYEFAAAGWTDGNGNFNDEMQEAICKNILKMLAVFDEEGHSGSSAPYTIGLFTRLANFKPIGPLTGEDWEWVDHGHTKQNKRCSSVFKDPDGNCYNIDGKVFWEWNQRPIDEDEEGYPGMHKPYKSYYTCYESRVPVTFPYVVPDKPEYVYRYSDAEPPAPPQNEEGLI
jgi:hypothetical protein